MTCLFLVLICMDYVLFFQAGRFFLSFTHLMPTQSQSLQTGWSDYWKEGPHDSGRLRQSGERGSAGPAPRLQIGV